MMQTMLQDAWDAGIVTIVAAGNDGGTTAKATPQRLGTTDNGLITVGGIQNDGSIWPQSVRQGTRGSLTISAVSAALTCASNQDVSGTQQRDGTTFAAPQVAGLVAYFMSIPSLYSQFSAGGAKGVPAAVKKYLTDVGYSRAAGGPLAAYNQAEDAICLAEAGGNNKRTLQARDDPTLQPILSDGTIVASDVNVRTPRLWEDCEAALTVDRSLAKLPQRSQPLQLPGVRQRLLGTLQPRRLHRSASPLPRDS